MEQAKVEGSNWIKKIKLNKMHRDEIEKKNFKKHQKPNK
jgi:hypothetical protein